MPKSPQKSICYITVTRPREVKTDVEIVQRVLASLGVSPASADGALCIEFLKFL
jgi:hypothetical protein